MNCEILKKMSNSIKIDDLADVDETKKQFEEAEEEIQKEYNSSEQFHIDANQTSHHHHGILSSLLKPIR